MGHIDQGCLSCNTPLQLALGSVLDDLSLGIPRFLYPYKSRTPHFLGHLLAISRFGVSLSALHLYCRWFATSCCFSLSSSAVVLAIGHCYSLPLSSSLDLVDLFPDNGCPFLTPCVGHALPTRSLFDGSLVVYTVKMSQKERFSLFAHIPSIQLVTDLPDSCKGWAKEWMEKASFTRLNKLFEIDTSKRAYKVFLSDKNLLALIDNPKPFIIPVFPCLAPPSLTRLEERERKRQEGTLRQVLTAGRPSSSFAVRPPTQKRKEPTAHPVRRVRTSPPTSPSSSSTLSSLSSLSSSSSSDKPEVGVDGVVPPIICEEEEEDDEDMISNLRAGFPPPPVLVPSVTTATVILESDEKLPSVDDIAYHEMRKPFVVMENLSEESFKCMASSPPRLKSAYVLNRDEISELLK
ncbi:hypothetical protein CK203_084325 [Vitis vinifera]|uniref:Uncharacterized protein n=1 Tax=Vitis vinifera TaxID=29760 RepID=A0A438DF84_VITVI|nr:hypothetical protein CK203_084325 [Vitis vinifera]